MHANAFIQIFVRAYRKLYSSQRNSNLLNRRMENTGG